MLRAVLFALLLGLTGGGAAKDAPLAAENPQLEARMMSVAAELRCLVCQNQSIAESDSDLAKDLRAQVREMLARGRSEGEIIDYMVARYGDFVLWRPPFKANTALLWLGPLLLFAAALIALVRRLARERDAVEIDIPDAARARAERLLESRLEGDRS